MSATPSSSRRHSQHPTRSDRDRDRDRHRSRTHQRASTPPLPPYEPPTAPLRVAGQNALIALLQSQSLQHLKTHIQHASEKLTDSAGEVNERLTDARVRYQKEKQRKRRRDEGEGEGEGSEDEDEEGDGGDDGEEVNRLARLEEQVSSVTEQLEGRMRQMVDAEVKVDRLTNTLTDLGKEAEQTGLAAARQSSRQSRRRAAAEEEGDQEEDQDYEATPEREMDPNIPPASRKLDELLSQGDAQWDGLSLTQRYSTNNAYIGFYRIIHDAKHPGDDKPPLPHASTWFAHMEDPTPATAASSTATARRTRQQQVQSPSIDSDDVAIERERISLKCPLTLLPFRDPVTSTKCPHSFEREAITDMIAHSSTTVPGPPSTGRSRRVRSVKCPVCSVVLTAADLRNDPVLLRRVRRAEAALQREAEDDEFEADRTRQKRSREGRSGITVASDDEDMDVDEDSSGRANVGYNDSVRVKQERAMSHARSTNPDEMIDDDDDDDDDEE